MAKQRVEFQPKPGVVPEGTSDGETFDVVCTFKVKGGQVCLVQVGDTKMDGYDEDEKKEPVQTKQFKDDAAEMVKTGKDMGIPEPQPDGPGYA